MIVSFFTTGTPYEEEAKALALNLQDFGLKYRIYAMPNQGSWYENTRLKPIVLRRALESLEPDGELIYIDVDARVKQNFEHVGCDFGLHLKDDREVLTGTIFLKHTPEVIKMLNYWVEECQLNKEAISDQQVLQQVLEKHPVIQPTNTDGKYTQIFDSMAHLGEPVVEHYQASRKFKYQIARKDDLIIPNYVGKSRIRRTGQGEYYIVKPDPVAERYLDLRLLRRPNELRWMPGFKTRPLELLRPKFENKLIYIVGKGPSLDKLTKDDFPVRNAVVICINESIHKVEKLGLSNELFMLQGDKKLGNSCRPKKASMLLSQQAMQAYDTSDDFYLFDPMEYGLAPNALSASIAVKLAATFGAKAFKMLCFDSVTTGNLDYAQCIGYSSRKGGNPNRFLAHRKEIEKCFSELEWVSPEAHVVT